MFLRSKVKSNTFFVCREGGITNSLKTPAQAQDYMGRGDTFAVKRLNAVV